MSKFFIDCEFIEGKQDKTFLGFKYGETKPTIDVISIGIVSEEGREYYAISKDFNLKEAWNRYEIEEGYNSGDIRNIIGDKWQKKVYWIRDNVLKPIYYQWIGKDIKFHEVDFTYNDFKKLLNKYGKTNKQIAEEIVQFIDARWIEEGNISKGFMYPGETSIKEVKTKNVQFYGYYSDYDWVTFCWLFGKMIDLPKGFPMYCIDLKQELDSKINLMKKYKVTSTLNLEIIDFLSGKNITFGEAEKMDWDKWIKEHPNYPKQSDEHNALADAKWNFELFKFLKKV